MGRQPRTWRITLPASRATPGDRPTGRVRPAACPDPRGTAAPFMDAACRWSQRSRWRPVNSQLMPCRQPRWRTRSSAMPPSLRHPLLVFGARRARSERRRFARSPAGDASTSRRGRDQRAHADAASTRRASGPSPRSQSNHPRRTRRDDPARLHRRFPWRSHTSPAGASLPIAVARARRLKQRPGPS